jgi:hypothetical protein
LQNVKAILPSRDQFEVLREIAGAGFDYSATKRLCSSAGWQMVEDQPDLGLVQYFLWVGPGLDNRRLLSVGTPELDGPPHIYLPLFYFPEEEGRDPGEHDRAPFDEAYRRLADSLGLILEEPKREGVYEYPHRPGWPYGIRAWQVQEGQVILLQDEHDIQFGMDISLWLFAAEPEVRIPLPF